MCGTQFPDGTEAKAALDAATGKTRAPIATDGERRQLTVLFADVVGATALSGRLDPEALRDVLRAYHRVCTDCVTRYGGNVNQYLGDGVLAYFGHPAAHENDAERAVLAGLAIVAGVRGLDQAQKAKGEAGVEVRVGIHTGLVVVGELGVGAAQINHAIGETPNLAARIQGEAAPNSVCISGATQALVSDRFHLRALGARPLKGVANDTALFAVIAAVEADADQRQRRLAAPLVGRETELAHLLDRWALARRGQGQAVQITGEAGIGKSRLLRAFRERAAAEGNAWRTIFCSPFYQNSALHPIIDLIERAIHAAATEVPPDRAAALRRELDIAGVGDDTTFSLLGSLLGLADMPPVPGDLAPERRKRLTFDALIAWLRADARRQPLVVIVEDLHWIDASTRELFARLLERTVEVPMLIVLTFRPEFVPPWSPASHISTLGLTRLSPEDVVAVACGMTSGRALPVRIVDEIVRRTDGVPLFVEELTKAIVASGLLVERDGLLELAPGQPAQLDVPATLRDALTARLDRLGAAKGVAQLASVLGREFDYPVLQAVCDVPELELALHLATLNEAEIIVQSGVLPRSHFVFKHALIQEEAYDTLLKSDRRQHHLRVAQAYVARFPDLAQSRPELVAHHYSRALHPGAAVPYWQRAGELAVGRSGYEEAVAHLDAALEEIGRIPDSPERAAMELAVRVKIGPALTTRKGMGAAENGANYARACALAETLGESPERFMAMWGDWIYKSTNGQLAAAARRSEDLVSLGRKLGDDGYVLQAHHSRWTNFFFLGNVAIARADTLQGIRLYDRTRHRDHKHLYGGHDPGVCAFNFGATAAWATGHTSEALELVNASMSLSRDLDHVFTLASAHLFAPIVLYNARQPAAAQASAEQLLAACGKHGFTQWVGPSLIMAGASRTAQGDTAFGLKLIEDGLLAQRKSAFVSFTPMLLTLAAEANLRIGNHAHALELLSEAIEVSEKSEVGWYRPEAERAQADVMLQWGNAPIDEAIARVERAAARAKDQGAVVLELRAVTTLAHMLGKAGRPGEARKRLVALCGAPSEGLDSAELDEARRLLSTLD